MQYQKSNYINNHNFFNEVRIEKLNAKVKDSSYEHENFLFS